jgi:anaerobic selenocysteine-containing dehydrogenase
MELARRMGFADLFPWHNIEEMIEEQINPTGFTLDDLMDNPSGLFYGTPKKYREYEEKGFKTPSGKVEIRSSIFEKFGYDPIPIYREPLETPRSKPELAEEYPLILFTGSKVKEYSQSSWRKLPSLRRIFPDPIVEINPITAEEFGVKDGENVWVETVRGSIQVKAEVTEKILPGVVHIPHGWREGNANILTDHEMRDPVLGLMPLKTMLCKVKTREEGS